VKSVDTEAAHYDGLPTVHHRLAYSLPGMSAAATETVDKLLHLDKDPQLHDEYTAVE